MRLGIVCPYSLQAPGGVQFHIRDLAQRLVADGIDVRVLAPADEGTPLPDFVDPAGASLAIPYNGSVARLTFGPIARARVRRWLDRGRFDLVHLHEPQVPSLSMLALQAAQVPVVATFHTSMIRSRALTAVQPVLRPLMERISARIAVSEDARRTLVEHLGGDAVVIPNGVECCEFAQAPADSRFRGSASAPTVGFLGRLDEPRKGLAVLAAAWPAVLAAHPGARLLVAGSGDVAQAAARFDAPGVEFLGPVSEADKRALLRSVDVYVAPQTGGESFGIVLVEGMAAGTTVLASDLGAFTRVIDDGTSGVLFPTGDAAALAAALVGLLNDPDRRAALGRQAQVSARRFDWSVVSRQVLSVYDLVVPGVVPHELVGALPTGALPAIEPLPEAGRPPALPPSRFGKSDGVAPGVPPADPDGWAP